MVKKLLIIVIIAIAALAAMFGGGLLSVAPLDFNPKTQVYYEDLPGQPGPDASAAIFKGYWDDGSGTGQPELLDAPQYATSWKATGGSEAAVPVSKVIFAFGVFKGVAGAEPNQPEWRYFVSTGGAWELVKRTPAGTPQAFGVADAAFLPPNPLYFLQGAIDGWLRVELWGSWWTPGFNPADGDLVNDLTYEGRFVGDDAALISGRGTITAPPELKVFNVGERIDVVVDLGTACSEKVSTDGLVSQGAGWTLELFSAGQAKTVKTWNLGCGPGKTGVDASGAKLQYVVADADFIATATECKNTLELSLLNGLFLKDETSVKTIDIEKVAKPAAPKLEVTAPGGTWEEGETIHVKVITNVAGALVNLVVENENGVSLIRVERSPLNEFDFIPTVAGIYTATASIEVDCGASDPAFFTITIKDKAPPDTTGGDGAFPWLAVILLLAGILLFLTIFAPVPATIKRILVIVGVVLIFIGGASLMGVL